MKRCGTRDGVAALAALTIALAGTTARANGRFPAAQHVLIGRDAGDSSVIALRTTFGVLESRDNGHSFQWLCETSLQISGNYDPAVELDANDGLLIGLVDGLTRTADGCSVDRDSALEGTAIADLARTPDGSIVFAIETGAGAGGHLWRSDDGGTTFAARAMLPPGAGFYTVEAAASNPARVYASGIDLDTQVPVLYRSDDQGVSLVRTAATFDGAEDAYIAGIDPLNPDRVWIRAHTAASTALFESDDGGATARVLHVGHGALLGFAVSSDGQRIWIGGPDDGLLESTDGGDTFRVVSPLRVTCLRYARGSLYVCADWLRDGVAIARWTDGDPAPAPLLRFDAVTGPVRCAAPSPERDTCADQWSAQRALLQPSGPDAGVDVMAPRTDADAGMDAGHTTPIPASNCGCRTSSTRPRYTALAALAMALVPRRRRRPTRRGDNGHT